MENNKLLVVLDFVSNGYKSESLDIFSIIALLFGIIVIAIKNPIGSLMCLIGLFGAIASYLIIIGLNFIGFSYLIVYIGAISILFLFILMLINIRNSELLNNNGNSIPLALLIIILLNYTWFQISPQYITYFDNSDSTITNFVYTNMLSELINNWSSVFNVINKDITNIMLVTSNNWDGAMAETSHIAAIGMVLYTVFNIWLLLASIILLLAMVGAIVITAQPKRGISSMVEWLYYTQMVGGSKPSFPIVL